MVLTGPLILFFSEKIFMQTRMVFLVTRDLLCCADCALTRGVARLPVVLASTTSASFLILKNPHSLIGFWHFFTCSPCMIPPTEKAGGWSVAFRHHCCFWRALACGCPGGHKLPEFRGIFLNLHIYITCLKKSVQVHSRDLAVFFICNFIKQCAREI